MWAGGCKTARQEGGSWAFLVPSTINLFTVETVPVLGGSCGWRGMLGPQVKHFFGHTAEFLHILLESRGLLGRICPVNIWMQTQESKARVVTSGVDCRGVE
jgi:hypothetical protein